MQFPGAYGIAQSILMRRRKLLLLSKIALLLIVGCVISLILFDAKVADAQKHRPILVGGDPIGGLARRTYIDFLHEQNKYIPREKFPTGILVDGAGFYSKRFIEKANGVSGVLSDICLKVSEFWQAYLGLRNSKYFGTSVFPPHEDISDIAQRTLETTRVYSMVVTYAAYNYIDSTAVSNGLIKVVDGSGNTVTEGKPTPGQHFYVVETEAGKNQSYMGSQVFFGAAFYNQDVFGDDDNHLHVRLPPEFIITNGATGTAVPVSSLSITFPEVPGLDTWRPLATEPGTFTDFDMANAPLVETSPGNGIFISKTCFLIQATVEGELRYAAGEITYHPPDLTSGQTCHASQPDGQAPSSSAPVYITRLYPAAYRESEDFNTRCQAKNLVIAVDGFDVDQTRTVDKIALDFTFPLRKLRAKGYDVLLLDYVDGQADITKNAAGLMEILKHIPDQEPWLTMAPGYENQRAILLAASMGTQVSRWALAKLEEQGIDHHIGLWIPVDGPFVGAQIPWSIQALTPFLGLINDEAALIDRGLKSPAAKQLARRGPQLSPDPTHTAFYTQAAALNGGVGLPTKLRKVAISSGSGSGKSSDGYPGYQCSRAPCDNGVQMEYLNSGGNLFGGMEIDGRTEVWNGDFAATFYGYVDFPCLDGFLAAVDLVPAMACEGYEWHWNITSGRQNEDVSPGGYKAFAQLFVDKYNKAKPVSWFDDMETSLPQSTFIPFFSAIGYRGADSGNPDPLKGDRIFEGVTEDGYIGGPDVSEAFDTTQPKTDIWYGPEDPNLFPNTMDPAIQSKSPFDAIWYEHENHEHVIPGPTEESPEPKDLPEGTKKFVYNEMDSFSSQEGFSNRLMKPSPSEPSAYRMPSSENFLFGFVSTVCIDPMHCAPSLPNLLTVNTMTKKAMLQAFDSLSRSWSTTWDSGSSGMIGNWAIDKGDKFFLMEPPFDLFDRSTRLLSISAGTPARAMLQILRSDFEFDPSYWATVWDNGGSGGYLGPWYIHSTDLYTFGDFDGSGSAQLLATYPYVGNHVRERDRPGAGGRSEAFILRFNGTTWEEAWNNNGDVNGDGITDIHFLNDAESDPFITGEAGWPIRFGDHYGILRLTSDAAQDTLFSVNLLQDIFKTTDDNNNSGRNHSARLQYFASNYWPRLWSDSMGAVFDNRSTPGVIGSWNLRNPVDGPEDAFYKADIDGEGVDELISVNAHNLQIQNFDPDWVSHGLMSPWTLKYFAPVVGSDTVFGNYTLQSGDRFYVGYLGDPSALGGLVANSGRHSVTTRKYSAPKPKDLREQRHPNQIETIGAPEAILVVNPETQNAMIQIYDLSDPTQWKIVWIDDGSHRLGAWDLYQR
ncbi:MAG TPA: hypothetical protein VI895_10210 [Bdellovibrionota bacterium]|nr:hypothetical protein [Bdellovibrionota bacterium]